MKTSFVWSKYLAKKFVTLRDLSPGGGGGKGSVVTEKPKGGITENFGRIQRGTTQICLENQDIGGRGDGKSHQILLGGITSVK